MFFTQVRRRWVPAAAIAVGLLALGSATYPAAATGVAAKARPPCAVPVVQSLLRVADTGAPNGQRDIRLYRPPGPDSRRLPVLYLLPGLPGTDNDFAKAALVEDLVGRYCAGQRFVVAVPDEQVTLNAGRLYDTEWADDPSGRFDLETFVTDTMVRAVEGNDRRVSALRAIGGFSMGGFAAASIAMRHPTEYSTVLAVAGYFHIDDPDEALGTSFATREAHDPDNLIGGATRLHFFLADGDQDDLPVVAGESQRFTRKLAAHRVDVKLSIVRGGHTLGTLGNALPGALTFWHAKWPAGAG